MGEHVVLYPAQSMSIHLRGCWTGRYVDEEGVVTLKGRVAATIQSSDELVLTELIFNSGFKVRPSSAHSSEELFRHLATRTLMLTQDPAPRHTTANQFCT